MRGLDNEGRGITVAISPQFRVKARARPYLDRFEHRETNDFDASFMKLGHLGVGAGIDNNIGEDIVSL